MSDWSNHLNDMTTAERALEWAADWYTGHTELSVAATTFGHVCANAELERRRTAERERDEAKAALAQITAMDDFWM